MSYLSPTVARRLGGGVEGSTCREGHDRRGWRRQNNTLFEFMNVIFNIYFIYSFNDSKISISDSDIEILDFIILRNSI